MSGRAGAPHRGARRSREGGEVVLLATYTAMQSLRGVLARTGAAVRFWED